MPTRVYSNEDGNVNKKSIVVSRTREDKDIDLKQFFPKWNKLSLITTCSVRYLLLKE